MFGFRKPGLLETSTLDVERFLRGQKHAVYDQPSYAIDDSPCPLSRRYSFMVVVTRLPGGASLAPDKALMISAVVLRSGNE
jgi:hypothetical protein